MLNDKQYIPWTNVYGLARSLLAFGTLSTLSVHGVDALFRPLGTEMSAVTSDVFLMRWSLFALLGGEWLVVAKWIAIVILILTVLGWRPRITGLLHWWVSFSFSTSAVVVDGGDQVTAVLTLLLVPITLTDGRRWHWTRPRRGRSGEKGRLLNKIAGLVGLSSLIVTRLQVAIIYFQAAVAKLGVTEWANGTAVYYWVTHPVFGVPDWLETVVLPALAQPAAVMLFTWGVITLEVTLAMGLFMKEAYRPWLLKAGLAFHTAILFVHGLFSFFFPMAAALILYLRSYDQPFPLTEWKEWDMAAMRRLPTVQLGRLFWTRRST
jgi:antimicrobial peptide system SdpB family protein